MSKLTADDFDDFAVLYDGYENDSVQGVNVFFYSLSDISLIEEIKENSSLHIVSNDQYSQEAKKKYKIDNYLSLKIFSKHHIFMELY